MKKITLWLSIIAFMLAGTLYAQEKKEACMELKGFVKKAKCLKNKYDTAHKNAPKTGVEQFKKITNK